MKKMLIALGILTTMFIGSQSFAACGCCNTHSYIYPAATPCPCQSIVQPCCPVATACPCAQPTGFACPCDTNNNYGYNYNNNNNCGCNNNNNCCCREKCSWWKFWQNKNCCDKCDSCCD